ncbi:SURF1-like protein [Sphaerisporangium rufum]|uniref:SURF1-like protein n=1 Tax=Sphaerisporangium rufum TaxID=1381558 RepID=A0A919QYQ3_9ACTN|nr:SURF1 family protein [Sphaerisporangium rufum]GII75280.1 SURF1-like protein [Sphaerisporangium rufum]
MLRTLFSPRLLGMHLLAIGVLVAFTILGRWQLGVFQESGRPHAATDPAPVAITSLAAPGERVPPRAANHRVTAQGTFDTARQLLVADRAPDVEAGGGSGTGYWLLTPLRLADGTLVPVVRGWVPAPGDPAAAAPSGPVTVSGRWQPSEPSDFARPRAAPLPAGQLATVSTAELINVWPGARVRDGFVVTGAPVPGGVRAVAAPPPTVAGSFSWRNLAYAAQWWIFAGFAVFIWFHYVRDAVRAARGARSDDGAEAASPALGASPQA